MANVKRTVKIGFALKKKVYEPGDEVTLSSEAEKIYGNAGYLEPVAEKKATPVKKTATKKVATKTASVSAPAKSAEESK